jgi:hypothetical protein
MMRRLLLSIAGLTLCAAWAPAAVVDRPSLSGTWKIDQARSQPGDKDIVLVIDQNRDSIHIQEIRGPKPKEDVSDFTCDTMGKQCPMQDAGDKAEVSVYYNGPVLIVLKTHGRPGSSVEKRRLSLSPSGDSLMVDVIPIVPEGQTEKLLFSKAQ